MASLQTKNFTTLVQGWVAAAQAACKTLLDFTEGSILLAVAEATSGVALWLQGLILTLLKTTRLATSQKSDVDTWIADYGLERIGATPASGLVTFSRATPTNPSGPILVGSVVQTLDGTQTFAVYADATNVYYNASLGNGVGGYVIPAAVNSINVPVQAVNGGSQGNVAVGSIALMQTGISGVDVVTNPAAFTNGIDAESDPAVKQRFIHFINQLAKGTAGAITYAAQSLQQGIQVQIFENQTAGGLVQYGLVTVFVDDGSGAIPPSLLAEIAKAIEVVRAAGPQAAVLPATILQANIVVSMQYRPGYYVPTVIAQVSAAISAYVNGIGLGDTPADGTLFYTRIEQVAYDTSPGVLNVVSVSINGNNADLVPLNGQTIKVGLLVVS
jgi:uncharacterized phage protein gp47/JayE